MKSPRCALIGLGVCLLAAGSVAQADLPSVFDLRDVAGESYVTPVKSQTGGTCWTHGTMASIESNLLMTGVWEYNGELDVPNLAEYHLDWWNGFNQFNNDDLDPPTGNGLVVHEGGDYMVASAYLTRGEGAVRDVDGQSFHPAPVRASPYFHYYYPRAIEWYVAKPDLSNIDQIKQKLMDHGAIATCMCADGVYMQGTIHYQPPASSDLPTHSVAIVGWDDNKNTHAGQPGAWLCKNSWGAGWGESGYFWISYYDKWCCQEPQMGAVSFQDVERLRYDYVYYHDYHGWRDTLANATEAFNAFVATGDEMLEAVSFFVAASNVSYTVRVYDRFQGGALLDELASVSGVVECKGFVTVDLARPIGLPPGDDFYIYLELSHGGHPYDCSSDIPVLLGAKTRTWVDSTASPGQSLYRSGGNWVDLTGVDATANFCIKALASDYQALEITCPNGLPDYIGTGAPTTLTVAIADVVEDYVPGSAAIHYRYSGGTYDTMPLTPIGGDLFEVTLPPAGCDHLLEYYFTADGSLGSTTINPAEAPSEVHTTFVGTLSTVLTDDFNGDLGWTVVNQSLQSGAWERGVPAGSGTRGDPATDFDGSGSCYLTGNAPGDSDVDGGPTRLVSPLFDLSGGGYYRVSYARWFTNDNEDEDVMTVQLSNNDGASWVGVETVRHTVGWVYTSFAVNDYVTPTAQVRVRFNAKDNPNNSITEAALDAFGLLQIVCTLEPGDMNCDGEIGFGDINPFVLALTEPAVYEALYGDYCDRNLADLDGDQEVDFGDINPFVDLLVK